MPPLNLFGSAPEHLSGRLDGTTHTLAQLLQGLVTSGKTGCLSLSAARGRVTGAINLASGKLLNARLGAFSGEEALTAAQAVRRLDYQFDKGVADKAEALPADALAKLLAGPVQGRLNLAACTVYSVDADGRARGGRSDGDVERFSAEYRYLRHYGDAVGTGLAGAAATSAVVWESAHCLGYRDTQAGITGIIAPSTHSLTQILATL